MIKARFGLIFGLLVLLGGAYPAFAHVIVADGQISALLHVNPGDDPVAGEASTLLFEFMDRQHKFDVNACVCNLVIRDQGKELYNEPMSAPFNGLIASAPFTFPQVDVYQLVVTGEPKTTGTFPKFQLNYDLRVERVTPPWYRKILNPVGFSSVPSHHLVHIGGAGIFAAVVFGMIIWENLKKFIFT